MLWHVVLVKVAMVETLGVGQSGFWIGPSRARRETRAWAGCWVRGLFTILFI